MIDFKTSGAPTWKALHRVLGRYRELLTEFDGGETKPRAVTVVVSGNRPWKEIAATSPRWAGVDGRLPDLDSDKSRHLMPLVSDRWGSHFRWRGDGPIPDAEREKLREIRRKATAKGVRLRFWATPEKENVWKELLDAGIDHINTDQLARLRSFLEKQDDPSAERPSKRAPKDAPVGSDAS